jgi:hypothetical protein
MLQHAEGNVEQGVFSPSHPSKHVQDGQYVLLLGVTAGDAMRRSESDICFEDPSILQIDAGIPAFGCLTAMVLGA